MQWTSILAIFFLFFVFSAFVLLVAALLPVKILKVRTAADIWRFGRSPIVQMEDVFTRLFYTLPSRLDLAGRFFGKTLPFA